MKQLFAFLAFVLWPLAFVLALGALAAFAAPPAFAAAPIKPI